MSRLRVAQLSVLLVLVLSAAAVQAALNSVFVQSRLDYNAILISGVDVIFLYDEALVEAMPQTKSAWFAGKEAFMDTARDDADVVSVFIPQGFDSEMMSLPAGQDEAVKVFVYAEHDASDRAPIDITAMENVLVEIDQFGILVSARN